MSEVVKIAAGEEQRKPGALAHKEHVALMPEIDEVSEPVAENGGRGGRVRGGRTDAVKQPTGQPNDDHHGFPCLSS
jgi:hypothetical protein